MHAYHVLHGSSLADVPIDNARRVANGRHAVKDFGKVFHAVDAPIGDILAISGLGIGGVALDKVFGGQAQVRRTIAKVKAAQVGATRQETLITRLDGAHEGKLARFHATGARTADIVGGRRKEGVGALFKATALGIVMHQSSKAEKSAPVFRRALEGGCRARTTKAVVVIADRGKMVGQVGFGQAEIDATTVTVGVMDGHLIGVNAAIKEATRHAVSKDHGAKKG